MAFSYQGALASRGKFDDFVWDVLGQADQLPLVGGKVPNASTF